jgi:PAS domain-containing protein
METHAILIVDRARVIHVWSAGAQKLLGYDAQDARGQTLDLIVPPEYRDRHWSGFRAAMGSGVAQANGAAANIPVLCRDEDIRRCPGRFLLLRDALGSVIGAAAIFAPYSEKAEELYQL